MADDEEPAAANDRAALMALVAAQDLNALPEDLPEESRFLLSSIRAVARRDCEFTVFVASDAPWVEGENLGCAKLFHMQDGYGDLNRALVLAARDVNNGAFKPLTCSNAAEACVAIDALDFGDRNTVVWDGNHRVATHYPSGVGAAGEHTRLLVPSGGGELTQDEVKAALDRTYNDDLKTPAGHTIRLWTEAGLVQRPEGELERHLKVALGSFFAGRDRAVFLLAQTPTSAGRTDLILLQRSDSGGPQMSGVLELKAIQGGVTQDTAACTEGLSQGYWYRDELGLPFAILVLYDVNDNPSHDIAPLLVGASPTHTAVVRVLRYPLYPSSQAWRNAGGYRAA
jgi:hypothetical protein